MGSSRNGPIVPDLFAAASAQETASRSSNPTANAVPRHVLPSDLPAAIKHLNDQELEQLLAAVIAEQVQRGKKPPTPQKTPSKRVEAPAASLSVGRLNAVRAAFKAGVTPSKIAKQFRIPQADVRKVIASEKKAPT